MLDADTCYEMLKAHDRRFDGLFFVGVCSTGIYCRSCCPAKLPKRENCTFYKSAAEAEAAGFRPCLKCRPEIAPGLPANIEVNEIAMRAALLLRSCKGASVCSIACKLSVSERHLRRIFKQVFGTNPVCYRTTWRLLLAKSLLTDTQLRISQIARASGFSSTRRFEEAFFDHYHLSARRWRTRSAADNVNNAKCLATPTGANFSILLGYRPPYSYDLLVDFLRARSIEGVECVGKDGIYRRSVCVGGHVGWISIENVPEKEAIKLTVSTSLLEALSQIVTQVRLLFDTDCDPLAIHKRLADFYERVDARNDIEGIRVPCGFDGFEIFVRAVVGQQITVRAASTLAGRIAAAFGRAYPQDDELSATPFEELRWVFAGAERFCSSDATDKLVQIGVIRTRADAICKVARKIVDGKLELKAGADVEKTMNELLEVKGIGPWTAHYVAMRALAWPDAFPAHDLGVRRAFTDLKPREIEKLSQNWRPYRSYAVMSLWSVPHA